MGIIKTDERNIEPKWTIADTEFILRLVNDSRISGPDVEQAALTINKLKKLHSFLLNREL